MVRGLTSRRRRRWPETPIDTSTPLRGLRADRGRLLGARTGAILQRNRWTQRHPVDDPADGNQLSGLQETPKTIGHGLLSGRPQVRVLPGAR